MSEPDPDAILYESPIHEQGRTLGGELAAAFGVADHRFFREIARWAPLRDVLAGAVGDPDATMDALIGLGEGCPNGGMLLSLGAHAFAVAGGGGEVRRRRNAKRAPAAARLGRDDRRLRGDARPSAGSDVMAMETRYAETRNGYVLNGEKAWISNATQADVFVIFATKDPRLHSRGVSAFLVERATSGVTHDGGPRARPWRLVARQRDALGRPCRPRQPDRAGECRRPGLPALDRPGAHPACRRFWPARSGERSTARLSTRRAASSSGRRSPATSMSAGGSSTSIGATRRPGCFSSTPSTGSSSASRRRPTRAWSSSSARRPRSRAISTPSASTAPRVSRPRAARG